MTRNVAASVHQRLLNIARSRKTRFNDLLQRYALERWLYRLSVSDHADSFVLKGALMLSVWDLPVTRPTKDIDLLAALDNDLESILGVVKGICAVSVQEDGLSFDPDRAETHRIAEEALYEGVRASFPGAAVAPLTAHPSRNSPARMAVSHGSGTQSAYLSAFLI